MRLPTPLLLAVLAAGCAGGGHATAKPKPHGLYVARVTVHGQTAKVWLDAGTGRYRSTSATPIGHGAPRTEALYVFDGRSAEAIVGKGATIYRGSRRFVSEEGAPPAVVLLRQRLAGRPDMPDTTVTITRRQRAGPDGLFRIPRIPVIARVSQVRPGAVPGKGPTAYWIGPRWRHRAARSAAVWVIRGADRGYSVMYTGLEVDSGAMQTLGCLAIPTALADGTVARVVVLHAGLDGSFGCGPASESPDGVLLFGGSMLGSTMVIVTTPTESIQLTGPALTPQNAVPLARALRPVERSLGSV
jgi:hypothetical protein